MVSNSKSRLTVSYLERDGFDPIRIKLSGLQRQMQRHAISWAYTVRNRDRWQNNRGAQDARYEAAYNFLTSIGLDDSSIARLSQARAVEVSTRFGKEAVGWETRIMPWEFLLNAAAKHCHKTWNTTVVRHLGRAGGKNRLSNPKCVLFVRSAPKPFDQHFSFDSERRLVKANFPDSDWHHLINPDEDTLRREVARLSPEVIHFTGVDNHEGSDLLASQSSDCPDAHCTKDGVYLSAASQPVPLTAEQFADCMTAGSNGKPEMVFVNTYYSAARTAALCVGAGAHAAIGFQDVIDNEQAESFIGQFYEFWRIGEYATIDAFSLAYRCTRDTVESMAGSGIVLWSDLPLGKRPLVDDLEQRVEKQVSKRLVQDQSIDPSEVLSVYVNIPAQINYSVLHNDNNLFDKFHLIRKGAHVSGVSVAISLQLGKEIYQYRETVDVRMNPTRLEDRIRVPLTWEMVRSIKESVLCTITWTVRWDKRVVEQKTRSFTLQPVQEWIDSAEHRSWLPSFILPRDPAVAEIVKNAERHLHALADNCYAGFDGYQSVDPRADEPWQGVDAQVQAIWASLSFDQDISYINPPPSYSYSTQRLRTPSEILHSRSGTCIDLALLMAACLEYVEIYPAIFLFKGHAFPGYWRQQEFYASSNEFIPREDQSSNGESPQSDSVDQGLRRRPWLIGGDVSLNEVLERVQDGELVPIESTALTERKGFAECIDLGYENFQLSPDGFELLVDIPLARTRFNVTPLPF